MSLLVLLGCFDPDARDVRTLDAHETDTAPVDGDSGTDTHGVGDDSGETSHETGDSIGGTTEETGETGKTGPVVIAIDLVSPSTGLTTGGESVTLYGGPFDETASVLFGGDTARVSATTQTALSVVTPAHAVEETVGIVVETTTGRGEATAAYTYVEPCAGITATPDTVTFSPASASGDATVRLDGCATGIVAEDETYVDANGATYGMTWASVPSEIDGTTTVTLHYAASARLVSASFSPRLVTDQGTVTVSVSVGP